VEVCLPFAEKEHYLPVQRPVQAHGEITLGCRCLMIAYDDQVTSIDLAGSAEVQAARGSLVTDERGTRQARSSSHRAHKRRWFFQTEVRIR
jgi:hypothetical protein